MAKDIIFKAKLNTQGAMQDAKNLGQQINQAFQDTSGADKLSQKLAELNKNMDEGNLSIRQYRTAIKEYQQIAQEAGLQSPIGKEAIERAARLKDTYSDMQQQVQQLSQDHRKMNVAMQGVNVAVNSYQAFTGVMGLLGGESEKYMQIMSKMMIVQTTYNAIMQITQALEKQTLLGYYARIAATKMLSAVQSAYTAVVGASTGAMKAFRIALVSTGVGALVVGLGLLIANFDKVVDWVKKAINYFKQLLPVFFPLIAVIQAFSKRNKELVDSNGEVIKSERQLEREHKKALREREREAKRVAKELKKVSKEYVDAIKENEKEYEKELIKLNLSNAAAIDKNNALMDKLTKDFDDKANLLIEIQQKYTDKSGKFTNETAKKLYDYLYKEAEKTQEQIEKLKSTNEAIELEQKKKEEAENKRQEAAKQRAEAEKQRLQKLADDYKNYINEINEVTKNANEDIEAMNTELITAKLGTFAKIEYMRSKDLEDVQEWYLEQLKFLEQYKNDKKKYDTALAELEEAKNTKMAAINTKYNIEGLNAEKEFQNSYNEFVKNFQKEQQDLYLQGLKEKGENELYIEETYKIKKTELDSKYEQMFKEAKELGDEEKLQNLQLMYDTELKLLEDNKNEEIKLNLEAEKKMAEDSLRIKRDSMREQSFLMIDALSQIFNNMSQLSEKNARQQKTFAYISLALSQAKAMGEAIYGAMKMMNELPADPISKIAFFVSTLATFMGIITSTIMQARQIASAGNMSGGGISSGVANNISSNYSAVQENKISEQQSQRVYVVESDITSTQNKIRKININQTL